jgi:hypothetical protein
MSTKTKEEFFAVSAVTGSNPLLYPDNCSRISIVCVYRRGRGRENSRRKKKSQAVVTSTLALLCETCIKRDIPVASTSTSDDANKNTLIKVYNTKGLFHGACCNIIKQ